MLFPLLTPNLDSGLESMHRKEVKGWSRNNGLVKEDSIIHSIKFHRLILDEAHSIKQRTTSVARACFALQSTYKWCLSGTPVQNRIGEFFSLLRFLEIKPFSCYFCKVCSCKQLHWSQDAQKRCTHCKHKYNRPPTRSVLILCLTSSIVAFSMCPCSIRKFSILVSVTQTINIPNTNAGCSHRSP